jgi:hypothetical protein
LNINNIDSLEPLGHLVQPQSFQGEEFVDCVQQLISFFSDTSLQQQQAGGGSRIE